MKIDFRKLSLTNIYVIWAALLIFLMIIYIFSGRYQEIMSQAVSKVDSTIPSNISHESMVSGFITISIIAGIVAMGVGYFLAIFSSKGKKWAQWLFLCFCLWQIKESTWGSYQISQMYPNLSFKFYEMVVSILSLCILIVLTGKIILLINARRKT